jgi:hypothetical protein
MTDYQTFFLIVAVFVVAYLLGKREGKDDGERAARGNAAQRRWEEEQRKKEEEAGKVHYIDGPRRPFDPNRGGSGVTDVEVSADGQLRRGFNPVHWD